MRRVVLAVSLISLVSCGGGSGSSTAPTPRAQAPTISTSNTMIFVGQTVQFAASGGGVIRWGGDAPSVATVDAPTGRVTGVGTGRVSIWAENEGGRTTRLLRGLPSYDGNWSGSYAIAGCQSTLDMSRIGFCRNFRQGEVLNLSLQISQNEDRVTGAFALGGNVGTLNASTIAENGQLPITGTFSSVNGTIRIDNARLESQTAGTMTGTFDQTWSVSGASGFGILACSVRNLTRTAGGPSLLLRAPGVEQATFEEMIRRMVR